MAHCLIWFNQDSHVEITLDAVPREGEGLQIEDDDSIINCVVESITHCLIRDKGRWKQVTDIFVKECEREKNPDIPW